MTAAITEPRPATLTRDQLETEWERLAYGWINRRFEDNDQDLGVTEATIDQAIAEHAPHLDPTTGWAKFEQYYEALCDLAEIRDDNADPRGWDIPIDLAEDLADDDREDALHVLTGTQS